MLYYLQKGIKMSFIKLKNTYSKIFVISLCLFTLSNTLKAEADHDLNQSEIYSAEKTWNNGFYIGGMGGVTHIAGNVRVDNSETKYYRQGTNLGALKNGPKTTIITHHFGGTGGVYSAVLGWGTSLEKWSDIFKDAYLGLEMVVGNHSFNETLYRMHDQLPVDHTDNYKLDYKRGLFSSIAGRIGYKPTPTFMIYTRFGVQVTKEKIRAYNLTDKNIFSFSLVNAKNNSKSNHDTRFTAGLGTEMLLTPLSDKIDLNLGLQYDFTMGRKNTHAIECSQDVTITDNTGHSTDIRNCHNGGFVRKLDNHTFQLRLTAVMGSFDM